MNDQEHHLRTLIEKLERKNALQGLHLATMADAVLGENAEDRSDDTLVREVCRMARERAQLIQIAVTAKALVDYETTGAAVAWPDWDNKFDALKSEIYAARKEKPCAKGGEAVNDREITPYQRIAELERENAALVETLEDLARQHCHTDTALHDYNGQVGGTLVTDSGGLTADSIALRRLADAGRFRIVASHGRMIVGYWPENDPQKKEQP